jgi:hypothetical protein
MEGKKNNANPVAKKVVPGPIVEPGSSEIGRSALKSGQSTFLKNLSPPFSGLKSKPCREPA